MSLPKDIPLQSVPLADKGADGELYIDINWWLFFYNLSIQIFPAAGNGGGGTPASPIDLMDMVDLDASGTDVPEAYRKISNNQLISSIEGEVSNIDVVNYRLGISNLQIIESSDIDLFGSDTADLRLRDTNVQSLLPDQEISPSLRDIANAYFLAADILLPDPMPSAQPAQTITVGASPFTYTAPFNGVLSITGGIVTTISIIRQATTVATGMIGGLVNISRSDQVQIIYVTAPTVVFLPS